MLRYASSLRLIGCRRSATSTTIRHNSFKLEILSVHHSVHRVLLLAVLEADVEELGLPATTILRVLHLGHVDAGCDVGRRKPSHLVDFLDDRRLATMRVTN